MAGTAEPPGDGRPDPADPFAGLVLDEEFVRAARTREAPAHDRLRRAGRIARDHGHLSAEGTLPPTVARGRRSHRLRRVVVALVLILAALALLAWIVLSGHSASGSGRLGAVPAMTR